MRIAVTGASGFVGGVVARQLAACGHKVFAYGRRPASAMPDPPPNYVQWELPAAPVNLPQVDAVVHCAALVGDWGPQDAYTSVNVDGTRTVLQAFRQAARFIHVSSASVYSSGQRTVKLREEASIGRGLHNAYAWSKAQAETAVQSSGRDALILRPHIVYGPGDTTLMPRVLAARRFGWLAVPGNGRNRISVTHIFNFVHAVKCALESSATHGVFNIVDDEDATVDQLLRTLLQRHGVPARLLYVPRPLAWAAAGIGERIWQMASRPGAPRLTRYRIAHIADEFTLDLTQARQRLGYRPRFTFHDAPIRGDDAA